MLDLFHIFWDPIIVLKLINGKWFVQLPIIMVIIGVIYV